MAWDRDEPIALVLEYNGPTPQPLFVMGRARRHRGRPARRDPPATGLRRGAATSCCRPIETAYRVDPGPTMVRMWVDQARFRPYPAIGPATPAGRDRRPQPALPARLRVVAPARDGRRRRLLRDAGQRPAGRRRRDPRHQPRRPPGGRRQRPDPRRLPRPGVRHGRHRRGHRRAAADLRRRSCSTSAPTTRPRSTPTGGWATAEHVRFEERLVHRLGSPWPDLTSPLRRLFSRKETHRR